MAAVLAPKPPFRARRRALVNTRRGDSPEWVVSRQYESHAIVAEEVAWFWEKKDALEYAQSINQPRRR